MTSETLPRSLSFEYTEIALLFAATRICSEVVAWIETSMFLSRLRFALDGESHIYYVISSMF